MSDRLAKLRQLAEIAPDDPMAHYGVGLELVNLERWPEAVAAFNAAIQVEPRYSAAYYHKARSEIAAGDPDAARATLTTGMATARDTGDMKTENEMRELLETL